jgi:hypothetical protein
MPSQKWTGSSTLGTRFHVEILSDPKGFTRKSFSATQARYDELKTTLRTAVPEFSEPSSPDSDECPREADENGEQPTFTRLPPPRQACGYWNEYEYGSDGGPADDSYAIYVNPDDEGDGFPDYEYLRTLVSAPFRQAKLWFSRRPLSGERAPLLPQTNGGGSSGSRTRRPSGSRSATTPTTPTPASSNSERGEGGDDDDDDDFFFSSGDEFPPGYAPRYAALPSINDQRVARYRERVYFRGMAGSFAVSFVLMAIAAVLLSAGRRKARLEVEAGATVGIVSSVVAGVVGLGLFLLRRDRVSAWHRAAVWAVFLTGCCLDVMLLVLVMEA